jgi:hypothetical protein
VTEFRIDLREQYSADTIDECLKALATIDELRVSHPIKPRTRPDTTHWHLSSSHGSGTVEVTLHPGLRSLTIVVRRNRRGTWAGDAAPSIAERLQSTIGQI